MRRAFIVLLCCASARCTIDRAIPLERFACEKGGPCADAGETQLDANQPDTGEPDAGTGLPDAVVPDAMLPHESCMSAVPLSPSGHETGLINDEANDHNGMCSLETGGLDKVFYFYTPGKITKLKATTLPSDPLNTLLYLYKNECDFGNELACNDDTVDSVSAEIEAINLMPGVYYLVLDMFNAGTLGQFTLDVSAKLASGELCDPAQPFLDCEASFCNPRVTPPRCSAPKDCRDLIDNDGDSMIDEDTCNAPPVVTCSPNTSVQAGGTVFLNGTATDDGTLIGQGWELVRGPAGDFPIRLESNTRTATLSPDLVGEYVLRYSAADSELQATACETTVSVTTNAPLLVEMVFSSGTFSELLDVDLHVLSPSALAWFDDPLDCSELGGCGFDGANFAHTSATGSPGIEVIEVRTPLRDGRGYEIAAHYFDDDGQAMTGVQVFIHCDGEMRRMFGPKTLLDGNNADEFQTNDFWKVAMVTMMPGGGCSVLTRDQIITEEQAYEGR